MLEMHSVFSGILINQIQGTVSSYFVVIYNMIINS